ncbi:acyltransferase [Algicola sagamiensis]|uniref:acyltransferase n=1 Tax=Algicola sagamiensis TaxID=163869 RepID=UPI00035F1D8A|nr:acyltransferase [Algicola sagamiensis]
MLSILPSGLLIILSFCLYAGNVAVNGTLIATCALLQVVAPSKTAKAMLGRRAHQFYRYWAIGNYLIMNLTNDLEWEIEIDDNLSRENWYLMISNHISWLDIFVTAHIAVNRIPEPKFFLKEQLRYMPFVGMACMALDMPFMKRYSKAYLEKNPHLKGKDIETTRASCQKFKDRPTTMLNFVEGTRFTEEKHTKQKSVFKHLLQPKAGGIAFTLAAMGEQFDAILNVTLIYPHNQKNVTFDLLQGKLKKVIVKVETLPVTDRIVGDYFEDEAFKAQFQQWLNTVWEAKDAYITQKLEQELQDHERPDHQPLSPAGHS